LKLKIAGIGSGSRFKYRLKAKAYALDFQSRLRLRVLYPGSGSKLFEPRLDRLRLSVFEPVDNIIYSDLKR
jgi:hypothetical protein